MTSCCFYSDLFYLNPCLWHCIEISFKTIKTFNRGDRINSFLCLWMVGQLPSLSTIFCSHWLVQEPSKAYVWFLVKHVTDFFFNKWELRIYDNWPIRGQKTLMVWDQWPFNKICFRNVTQSMRRNAPWIQNTNTRKVIIDDVFLILKPNGCFN